MKALRAPTSTIRAVIADQQALVLAAVAALISLEPDIQVVAKAGDGQAALEAVRLYLPDVLLCEGDMPGINKLQRDEPVVPTRLGSVFFSTGPYFARARAILAQDPEKPITAQRRAMLQAHLNYVEAPPPIDDWKKHLGTEDGAPRLHHLVGVWGMELGLKSTMVATEVMKVASYPSDVRAAALIEGGERTLTELINAPQDGGIRSNGRGPN